MFLALFLSLDNNCSTDRPIVSRNIEEHRFLGLGAAKMGAWDNCFFNDSSVSLAFASQTNFSVFVKIRYSGMAISPSRLIVTPRILQLFNFKNFSDLFQDLPFGLILRNSLDFKLEHFLFPCSSSP